MPAGPALRTEMLMRGVSCVQSQSEGKKEAGLALPHRAHANTLKIVKMPLKNAQNEREDTRNGQPGGGGGYGAEDDRACDLYIEYAMLMYIQSSLW